MDLLAYDVKRAHWGMTCTALRRFWTEAGVRPELERMTPARFEILSAILLRADVIGVEPGYEGPRMPLTQIVHKLGLDRSTIARSVRRMEQLGYVKRLPHETDRRLVVVMITKLGLRAMASARELLAQQPSFLVERVHEWLGAIGFGLRARIRAHRRLAYEARMLAREFGHWSHAIFDPAYDHREFYLSSKPHETRWNEGPTLRPHAA